jgi:predicted transcriptional regulator
MPKTPKFSDAIREAANRQGLSLEEYRRKHEIPQAHFYRLLGGREPIPDKVRVPLRRLKAAGVKHPLLDLV